MDFVRAAPDGVYLFIYVQPGSKTSGWAGVHDRSIKLRLRAPAVDGKANQAVVEFLADYFSLPLRRVEITKGQASRKKTVFLRGVDENHPRLSGLSA